jgi:hypothetical protein
MRGRLWVAVLYAGPLCTLAAAQANAEATVPVVSEVGVAASPSALPPRPPLRVRPDVERTNFGWVALLGLSSLTAANSQRRPPAQSERR